MICKRSLHASVLSRFSLCDPMDCTLGSSARYFSGKNTGVGCHTLLRGIFLTQGSNPYLLCLLHCRQILYLGANREAQKNIKRMQKV